MHVCSKIAGPRASVRLRPSNSATLCLVAESRSRLSLSGMRRAMRRFAQLSLNGKMFLCSSAFSRVQLLDRWVADARVVAGRRHSLAGVPLQAVRDAARAAAYRHAGPAQPPGRRPAACAPLLRRRGCVLPEPPGTIVTIIWVCDVHTGYEKASRLAELLTRGPAAAALLDGLWWCATATRTTYAHIASRTKSLSATADMRPHYAGSDKVYGLHAMKEPKPETATWSRCFRCVRTGLSPLQLVATLRL